MGLMALELIGFLLHFSIECSPVELDIQFVHLWQTGFRMQRHFNGG